MTADTDALRLVPVEPTEAMIEAGCRAMHAAQGTGDADAPMQSSYQKSWEEPDTIRWKQWIETIVDDVWPAMLAAAPAVQPAAGREEIAQIIRERAQIGGTDWHRNAGGADINAEELAGLIAAISTPAQASEPIVHIQCETRSEGVIGTTNLDVVRVEQNDDGSFTVVTDHWPAQASETGGEERKAADAALADLALNLASDLSSGHFGMPDAIQMIEALATRLAALSAPQAAPGEGEGES